MGNNKIKCPRCHGTGIGDNDPVGDSRDRIPSNCPRCGGSGKSSSSFSENITGMFFIVIFAIIAIAIILALLNEVRIAIIGAVLDYINYVKNTLSLSVDGVYILTAGIIVFTLIAYYTYWSRRIVKEVKKSGFFICITEEILFFIFGIITSVLVAVLLVDIFPNHRYLYFYAFIFFSRRLAKLNGIAIILFVLYQIFGPLIRGILSILLEVILFFVNN